MHVLAEPNGTQRWSGQTHRGRKTNSPVRQILLARLIGIELHKHVSERTFAEHLETGIIRPHSLVHLHTSDHWGPSFMKTKRHVGSRTALNSRDVIIFHCTCTPEPGSQFTRLVSRTCVRACAWPSSWTWCFGDLMPHCGAPVGRRPWWLMPVLGNRESFTAIWSLFPNERNGYQSSNCLSALWPWIFLLASDWFSYTAVFIKSIMQKRRSNKKETMPS